MREKSVLEAERGRQRAGIVDLEEECEDEEEEEDMDERRTFGTESAGEDQYVFFVVVIFLQGGEMILKTIVVFVNIFYMC